MSHSTTQSLRAPVFVRSRARVRDNKAANVMLDQITPVLLTYNEELNISRTLSRIGWAKDIVVVDSGSTDGTLEMLAKFSNVRIFKRSFDTHASQWRYAIEQTGI